LYCRVWLESYKIWSVIIRKILCFYIIQYGSMCTTYDNPDDTSVNPLNTFWCIFDFIFRRKLIASSTLRVTYVALKNCDYCSRGWKIYPVWTLTTLYYETDYTNNCYYSWGLSREPLQTNIWPSAVGTHIL